MLSWLYMVPFNIGESKKTHKCKYRREYRREKFCRVQEETILFFDIQKGLLSGPYYHIPLIYLL